MYKQALIKKTIDTQQAGALDIGVDSTRLQHKISTEIEALEQMLNSSAEYPATSSIKLLSPTLRSVIRSKKRMLVSLNETHM